MNLEWQELALLLMVPVLFGVLLIWPAWRVISKMGFPGALSFIALIPAGGLVLLIVFAIVEWPVERELRAHRSDQERGIP